MHSLLELAWIMGGLKMTPIKSYTAFNLASIAVALLRRHEGLLPVLFANSLALHSSFYLMRALIDKTFFRRMMDMHMCTPWQFCVGDFCIHWLPSLAFVTSLFAQRGLWARIAREHPLAVRFAGFYSLLLNLLWAVLNFDAGSPAHFDISNVYVPLGIDKWSLAWHTCAVSHLGFGALLSKLLAPPPKLRS